MSYREFESPVEVEAALRALAGIHRASRRERIWVGVTSMLMGGFAVVLGVVLLVTAQRNTSPVLPLAFAVGSLCMGSFLLWNLWRFLNMEYHVTERGLAYCYPSATQRWSVPIEEIDSLRRVSVQDGERLQLRVRTGKSRWVYLTRSMRKALDSLPTRPAA